MKNSHYVPLSIIVLAILTGCNTTTHNAQLQDAHERYARAQSNPQVTTLAAAELKVAANSLEQADSALSKGEGSATVDQLAYVAAQQIAIAQETAKQKEYEMAVTNASANRNQIRLEARTAEAEAAKHKMMMANKTLDRQAEDLAAADANAQSDQALIVMQEMKIRELNAKQTDRGVVVTLGDVLFSTNKSELKADGKRNVQKVADFLMQYPQRVVLIEGFTDSTGSASYNQKLSERRAESVRTELVKLGINSARISTAGYGEERPVANNDTAAHRQLNRRIEIIFPDSRQSSSAM